MYCICPFKPNFKMEKYLICLNKNQRIAICKFRTNNTHLPKVTGRLTKTKLKGTNNSVLYVMRLHLGMNIIYCLNFKSLNRKYYMDDSYVYGKWEHVCDNNEEVIRMCM